MADMSPDLAHGRNALGGYDLPWNPCQPMLNSYQASVDRTTLMAAKDTAKLSAKFQISIPKAVRTARGWMQTALFKFLATFHKDNSGFDQHT